MMDFDVSRAKLSNKAKFKPFQVSMFLNAKNMGDTDIINENEGILIFELNNEHYGFLSKQMAYHHVANGDIDGEAFMISF